MPAPPELRYRAGGIGIIEVLLIVETDHQAHADGHIRIGGKVQINLQHKAQHAEPKAQSGPGGQRRGILRQQGGVGRGGIRQQQGVRQSAAGIGQQSFLPRPVVNRPMPRLISVILTLRYRISSDTSRYRTMGPAIH